MRRKLWLCLLWPFLLVANGCALNNDYRIQDREQISERIFQYGRLWDLKDADGVARLFLEDGVMEWRLGGAAKQPPLVSGHDDILRYTRQAHEVRLAGRQSRHHFSGLMFEKLSDDEAVTQHMFLVTHIVPGQQPELKATGTYRIQWKKTSRGWLMSHRILFVDR